MNDIYKKIVDELHYKTTSPDWKDKPSLFAQWTLQYFPPKGSILKLGFGHGQDTRFFAAKGYKITTANLPHIPLHKDIQKLPENLEHVAVIPELDSHQPFPFADYSFDIVYSHLGIHFFDTATTQKIFNEAYRILKPQGIVAFFVKSTEHPECKKGTQIEEGYFQVNKVKRHYFSIDSIRQFASQFKVISLDNQGQLYEDFAEHDCRFIRFIGKK